MKKIKHFLIALIILVPVCDSPAKFMSPELAPIERLTANTEFYIRQNPKDAHGYYILARLHYMAFASRYSMVYAYNDDKPPKIPPYWKWRADNIDFKARYEKAKKLSLEEMGYTSKADIPKEKHEAYCKIYEQKVKQLEQEGWKPDKLDTNKIFEHAGKAFENFQQAIELDPENGLYHLGLASLLEQYVQTLSETNSKHVPEQFRKFLLNEANEVYYQAYRFSIREDLVRKNKVMFTPRDRVGYEAGSSYIRLTEKLNIIPTKQTTKEINKIKDNLKKIEEQPLAITPIIFSLERDKTLLDLITPDKNVYFDINGDGIYEFLPWVQSDTAILVWDPDSKGVIESGRQLFGSVSWWLFFRDGYHALNALDDNRDGTLTGCELEGIKVWYDRNSDGKSNLEEIVSLKELKITSISTKQSGKVLGCPFNKSGITFSDRTTVSTYDWVVSPITNNN